MSDANDPMGPVAQQIGLDRVTDELERSFLRLHFNGGAFGSVVLTPENATSLGLALIQLAAQIPRPEPPMIVVPNSGVMRG